MGLCCEAVTAEELDAHVDALARRIAAVPKNQLMMQKMVVNQASYPGPRTSYNNLLN